MLLEWNVDMRETYLSETSPTNMKVSRARIGVEFSAKRHQYPEWMKVARDCENSSIS